MSKTDNLHDYLADLADAIREKKGTTEPINAQSFAEEIRTIESGGNGWTGHADVEGLKAIGWDDEDIAYYQKHGVNWNEEDDEYHKVSDDNKALYGVLTADNIQDYKDRIVYLPKIDFSGVTSMTNKFKNCTRMIATASLDINNATSLSYTFDNCYSLVVTSFSNTNQVLAISHTFHNCSSLNFIRGLETSNVTNMQSAFYGCSSLSVLPHLDTSNVTDMYATFQNCYRLSIIPPLDTRRVTNMRAYSYLCYALNTIDEFDAIQVTNFINPFVGLYNLVTMKMKNVKTSFSLSDSQYISKASLLYIINNEAATSEITITLHPYAYRLAEDADVVAALANHPLISLASA